MASNIRVRRSEHNNTALFYEKLNCYVVRLPKGGQLKIDEQDLWVLDVTTWQDARYVESTLAIHRIISPAPPDLEVDHKNHIRHDCRRSNLRVCTRQENNRNRGKRAGCSSRFKGVSFANERGVWFAYIKTKGEKTNLGCFDNEEEAARTYDAAAIAAFGKFAQTNESLGLFAGETKIEEDWPARLEHPIPHGTVVLDEQDTWLLHVAGWQPHHEKKYINARVLLHRLIMRPAKDQEVTIINGNPYDVRRDNLHLCVGRDFRRFRTRPNKGRKYKGVYAKKNERFSAAIRVNGRLQHIGHFATEEQASEAYQSAASQLIIK